MKYEQLISGNYYHIFNRGNNRCNLFVEPAEYEHFLWLYDKYISPIADTLAWVLMPNHFHLLVYIKEDVVYKYSISQPLPNRQLNNQPWEKWFEEHKWETIELSDLLACADPACPDENVNVDRLKKPVPYRHFGHLFNAYSRYLQIRTGRTGNLFERPFKRKLVANDEYMKQVILYIQNNPVNHGFCDHPLEYSWSSYISCISEKPTKLKRDANIKLFGGKENFVYQHKRKIDFRKVEKWLDFGATDLSNLSACAAPDNVGFEIAAPDNVGFEIAAPDNVGFEIAAPDNVGFEVAAPDNVGFEVAAPDNVNDEGFIHTNFNTYRADLSEQVVVKKREEFNHGETKGFTEKHREGMDKMTNRIRDARECGGFLTAI